MDAVGAERYGMIVAHAKRCEGSLQITIDRQEPPFLTLEASCDTCSWWDHWDERMD